MLLLNKKTRTAVIVCYVLSFVLFITFSVFSLIVSLNSLPREQEFDKILLTCFSLATTIIFLIIICAVMSKVIVKNDENAEKNGLFSFVKRFGYIFLYVVGISIMLGFAGGIFLPVILKIFFSMMRATNFPLFSAIVKVILFALYFAAFIKIINAAGYRDASQKKYNPHFILISIILTLTILMPFTAFDHMYNNSDVNRIPFNKATLGKTEYNLQTVFNKNEDYHISEDGFDKNEKFSLPWFIVSILTVSALQSVGGTTAYFLGKRRYYKKHPGEYEKLMKLKDENP